MRSYLLYLEDILKSATKVSRYTDGMTFEDFLADERTMDAVVRNLEIIGEAAKNVPLEVRSSISNGQASVGSFPILPKAVHSMVCDQLLSRDQLSALCESDEVPESGNIRVICPDCGACTGRGETAQRCRECRFVGQK